MYPDAWGKLYRPTTRGQQLQQRPHCRTSSLTPPYTWPRSAAADPTALPSLSLHIEPYSLVELVCHLLPTNDRLCNNMPPKRKKARKSTTVEPDEPLEYATYIREKSAKLFAPSGKKKNVSYDIEQNIREIRALLKINAEIFGRCMSSVNNCNDHASASFTRYGFDVIKVRQYNEADQTQIITEHVCSERNFDIKLLSNIPASLSGIFVVKYQAEPFTPFIDYDALFHSAIMLHDDILETFLAKLKYHIESIHVCLGKISWLLETNSNIEFIEATLRKKLEIPIADDLYENRAGPQGTYDSSKSDVCLTCEHDYGSHSGPSNQCPSIYGSYFKCKNYHLLKSYNESGKFEKTFAIAKQSDQMKLKKFLDFVAF